MQTENCKTAQFDALYKEICGLSVLFLGKCLQRNKNGVTLHCVFHSIRFKVKIFSEG